MNPVKLPTVLGINNRRQRHNLDTKEGRFVADAVNVDFGADGYVGSRRGQMKIVATEDAHSMWGSYFVDGSELKMLSGVTDTPTVTTVLTGLTPNVKMSYAEHGIGTFCSNGEGIWKLDGELGQDAYLPTPSIVPVAVASSGGSLSEGLYQIAVCHSDVLGRLSPMRDAVQIEVPANGAIQLTGIPIADGLLTDINITSCNGSMFYLHESVTSSTLMIPAVYTNRSRPQSLLMDSLPAGDIIRSHKGRLITAKGPLLFYTEPWSMLHDPMSGFMQFPEDITMVEPLGDGIFISADKTYWLTNGISPDTVLKPLFPYKALAGASGIFPDRKNVFWYSERGLVVGGEDGSAQNIQEQNVAVVPATRGAVAFTAHEGMKQLIATSFQKQQTSSASIGTYMDAEVIHQNPV